MARQLVVFDFDWSMADQDTDRWIFECLDISIRRKMDEFEGIQQWTDIVSQSLREAHAKGIKKEEIEHALKTMPFHPAMIRAITKLHAAGNTTFFCLSNANSIFINTILKSNGLISKFTEIVTNPAEWEPSGLLNLRRKIDPDGPQHNCAVGCSPNMCKGEELSAFLLRHKPAFDKIVYVGDGSNDFCPVLRLSSQDMVLCRSFGGLKTRIGKANPSPTCQVKYWEGAWEVEEIFGEL